MQVTVVASVLPANLIKLASPHTGCQAQTTALHPLKQVF
jgi:hypothetical protein